MPAGMAGGRESKSKGKRIIINIMTTIMMMMSAAADRQEQSTSRELGAMMQYMT